MEQLSQIANTLTVIQPTVGSSKELKKCDKCGDYIEFVRDAIVLNGVEVEPPKVLSQKCYCQLQAEKQTIESQKKQKENQRLLDKFKASEIPPRYLNWNFDNVQESENKKACQRYVDCFDINILAGKGLFLVGEKGTGKTTLAVCMQKELLSKGYTALIINFGEVLNRINQTYSASSKLNERQVLDEFLKFDFLVLDDFGRETYTDKRLENTFKFFDEMTKNMKCLCLTANPEIISSLKHPKRNDEKAIKAAVFYEAIWDRLRELCPETLKFTGNSFRGNN